MNDLIQLTPPAGPVDDFWALARSAVYLRGRGVTFGPPLLQPAAINPGVYSIPVSLARGERVAAVDRDLTIFADGSLDHILITPQIASCEDPVALLREASRKLKLGGHLILLTQVENPPQGAVVFNPAQSRTVMRELGSWQTKQDHQENGKHLLVVKKISGRRGLLPIPTPAGKRACVARYGALGDAIVMTPLLRALHEDGYHVTVNISSYCSPVLENNPHVGNLLIQERDVIPNHLLGRYWRYWEGQYDRYINLSESMEGDLLFVEGRPPFYTSKEWRHSRANVNYYDYTLARGGYPHIVGSCGELFFTEAEERRARKYFSQLAGKFTIVWALNGSSHHKVFPLFEPLLREWFRDHPEARVITVGDERAKPMEFGHFQLLPMVGKWSIRESLIATKYAHLVVGPETMMTNAAGCYSTPKIVFLSHSSPENLTKYWSNCTALEPTGAACYPCHQLHYTAESCPTSEVADQVTSEVLGRAPACTLGVTPGEVLKALSGAYASWRARRAHDTGATADIGPSVAGAA